MSVPTAAGCGRSACCGRGDDPEWASDPVLPGRIHWPPELIKNSFLIGVIGLTSSGGHPPKGAWQC
ncbi:hypothetical protein ABIA33_004042 [Streptacidiphilus sp. MAP12-16]